MCAIADGYPYKLYINLLLCSAVIQKACQQPAKKISNRVGKIKPDIKTKGLFSIMAMMQKTASTLLTLITGKPKTGRAENGLGRNDTHDLLITNEMYKMHSDKQGVLEKSNSNHLLIPKRMGGLV